MGRRAISEFQVKQTAYPNAGRSWYIVGRPGGKRIRAWFDTQLAAEAGAAQRNSSIQRFGQQAATFSGSLAYMAMECQRRLQEYDKSLHDATAHYLRHLEGITGLLRPCPKTELLLQLHLRAVPPARKHPG
jgi:hypothetical protein